MYYGADSGTTSSPYGLDFYIGQMGYGTIQSFDKSTGGDSSYFLKAGASAATYLYGYWLLSGMSGAPSGTTATNWGIAQGQAAAAAYEDVRTYYGANKLQYVIWVDCENIAGGLDYQDYTNNHDIYNGFFDWMSKYGPAFPGTYSSPYEWNTATMGSNFAPNISEESLLWLADYPPTLPTKSELATSKYWVNFPQTNIKPSIWQYNGTPDYNVASSLPGVN